MSVFQTQAFEQVASVIQEGVQIYNEKFASQRKRLIHAAKQQGLKVVVSSCGKRTDFIDKRGRRVGFLGGHSHLSLNTKDARRHLKDKYRLKELWQQSEIPVPLAILVRDEAELSTRPMTNLKFPLVVKPLSGSGGRGITIGVDSDSALRDALRQAKSTIEGPVIVEEFVTGLDVRCYMLNGQLVAACSRLNAYVVGDAVQTVSQLITKKNKQRRKHPHLKRFLLNCPVNIDAAFVPNDGEYLQLQAVSNLHQGGESVNVTELIPESLKLLLQKACAVIPSGGAIGLDLIVQSFSENAPVYFIEGNSCANINVHLYPMFGKPIDVASLIIGAMLHGENEYKKQERELLNSNEVQERTLEMIRASALHSSNMCSYAITSEAMRRNLKVHWLSALGAERAGMAFSTGTKIGNLFEISDQCHTLTFNKTRCSTLTAHAEKYRDKGALQSKLAGQCNMPESLSFLYPMERAALDAFIAKTDFPFVVKPVKGSMGKNVFVNLKNQEELEWALSHFQKKRLLIERFISGKEYRVYILASQVVAVMRRLPAHVVGDGKLTLKSLILEKNKLKSARRLPKIRLTPELEFHLRQQQLSLTHIPEAGLIIQLSDKLGRSAGGDIESCELKKYPILQKVLAHVVPDLDFFGADVIIDNNGKVHLLEINIRPQISSALLPDTGPSVDIPALMLNHYFPESRVMSNEDIMYDHKKLITALNGFNGDKMTLNEAEVLVPITDYHNLLPQYEGVASQSWDMSCMADFRGLGNINQLMLRRAAWQAGFHVDVFLNAQKKKRWTVQGNGRLLKFRENMPPQTSQATRKLTNDKQKTKQRLEKYGISVPSGMLISSSELTAASHWFEQLKVKKAVVKPLDGSGGRGVTSAIDTVEVLHQAIKACETSQVMLEQHIEGNDHRLLVVGGRFVAAILRDPASVVGDGKSSIKQLIELKNRPRKSNPYTGKTLLALDTGVVKRLLHQSLTPDSILESGRKVYLQSIANIGAGGDSYDITEQVHPDFVRLAEQCWHAFADLSFCGIDLLAEDIRRPAAEQSYAVIEINANCDVAMHHFPTVGQARDAAASVIDYLFEATEPVRTQQLLLEVRGKVQQVGYRRWLKKQAVQRGISGWVKNMPDGTVQALLCGAEMAVSSLVSICGRGPEKAIVSSVYYTEVKDPRATGFVIKEM